MVWVKVISKMEEKCPDVTVKMSSLTPLKCPVKMSRHDGKTVHFNSSKMPEVTVKMSGLTAVKWLM